jgi:probable rRNA maturation factor
MPAPTSEKAVILFRHPARGVARTSLRAYAEKLQSEVAGGRAFVCLIAGDTELRRLNRDFRKKDYPTDVLSFPAAEPNGSLGEIAISFDRARAQADDYKHEISDEIRVLMLHGVLHLMGMDHESDSGEMALAERKWRKHFGLPGGLIERVRA